MSRSGSNLASTSHGDLTCLRRLATFLSRSLPFLLVMLCISLGATGQGVTSWWASLLKTLLFVKELVVHFSVMTLKWIVGTYCYFISPVFPLQIGGEQCATGEISRDKLQNKSNGKMVLLRRGEITFAISLGCVNPLLWICDEEN